MGDGSGLVERRIERGRRVFEDEIRGLESTTDLLGPAFSNVVDLILAIEGKVVLCGVGKSGMVARKVAATLNSTGTPSLYLSPTDALHGDLGVVQPKDMLILFSRSGRSDEVAMLLKEVARRGIVTVLVTANPSSELAQGVQQLLPIADAKEACALELAPTTSTTSMIALGDALAVVLMEERGFEPTDFASNHPSGLLGRRLTMRLSDLMVQGDAIPQVLIDASFQEVVLEITRKRFGATLVMEGDRLAGIITDGDLRRAYSTGQSVGECTAEEIMTVDPMTAHPSEQAVDGLRVLENAKRTHLPIVDHDGHLAGMVHLHHLVEAGL